MSRKGRKSLATLFEDGKKVYIYVRRLLVGILGNNLCMCTFTCENIGKEVCNGAYAGTEEAGTEDSVLRIYSLQAY